MSAFKCLSRVSDQNRSLLFILLCLGIALPSAGLGGYFSFVSSGPVNLLAQSNYPFDSAPRISGSFAFATLVASDGSWAVPSETSSTVINAILNSGAKYVRVSGGGCPSDPTVITALQQLQSAGIHLGTYIATFYTNGPGHLTTPKPISVMVNEATRLKNCGFYDWITLDHIVHRSDAQDVVGNITSVGFNVVTNYGGWGYNNATGAGGIYSNPPPNAWGNGAAFVLLVGLNPNKDYASQAPILWQDTKFINYLKNNDPNSLALKWIDNPGEIDTFMGLPLTFQEQLLTAWAQGQSQYGYVMMYPLFEPGAPQWYDSLSEGTYPLIQHLIAEYGSLLTASATSTFTTSVPSTLTTGGTTVVETMTETSLTTSTYSTSPSAPITSSSVATVSPLVSPAIPGFPWEAIVAGVILGMSALAIVRRRRK